MKFRASRRPPSIFPFSLFACAITLLAGVIAGLAPVLMAGRIDLTSALKEGSRASGAGKQRQALRSVLVVAEVALTFVLAFGSGLLVRSLIAAQQSNPGFDPQAVWKFGLQLPGRSYRTPAAVNEFYDGLLADLHRVPGIVDASAVYCPPGCGRLRRLVLFHPRLPRRPRRMICRSRSSTSPNRAISA